MNDQRFYSLVELKAAAVEACKAAADRRAEMEITAVRWDSLKCDEAREWTNEVGERGYTVYLSDASPLAFELHNFVMRFLHERGYHGVEVVSEW